MYVVMTYDVRNATKQGETRLRRVASTCLDYGVDPSQWTECKARLIEVINPAEDSVRIYYLGSNWSRKVEHIGANEPLNIEGPLFA